MKNENVLTNKIKDILKKKYPNILLWEIDNNGSFEVKEGNTITEKRASYLTFTVNHCILYDKDISDSDLEILLDKAVTKVNAYMKALDEKFEQEGS